MHVQIDFPAHTEDIQLRLSKLDPIAYAKTRNYKHGAVSYLSPYISRGVLSTRQVFEYMLSKGFAWEEVEKFTQELAWRDYWQRVWIAKENEIFSDLKEPQHPIHTYEIPKAVILAQTGIKAIDNAIKTLYSKGYMHNHMRMYVASICCNIAGAHWMAPAQWMYANLLDGDLASNHLSWQWVAGTNSTKKYYANQDNINRYFNSTQKETFLDREYAALSHMHMPEILLETLPYRIESELPSLPRPVLEKYKTSLIYNYYNLDPDWHKGEDVQRILLLEPSLFKKYPVQQKNIDFMMDLAKNITGLKVFCGEFSALISELDTSKIIYKEHPLNKHYKGIEEPRDWLCNISGHFSSFFPFWKKCKKELHP